MAYTAVFAGTNLHDYFRIESIKRSILPQRTNFTKSIPSVDGEIYTGYKYNPKKIVLKCAIHMEDAQDRMDKLRQIAFRLDVKSPSKLILGDDPSVYTYAVLDGETNLEILKSIKGEFELTFICYDPKSYSIEKDVFMADRKMNVEISNGGSTDAFPQTQAVFSKDAFFFKCSDDIGRTVLVGTPPNIDKQQAPMSPAVLRDNCQTLEGWNPVANVIDAGREINGNLVLNGGGFAIALGNAGSNANGWHGGGLRKNLNQNLTDFRVEVRLAHNSLGDVKGVGAGTKEPIKSGTYIVTAEVSLWVREGRSMNTNHIGYLKHNDVVEVSDIQHNWGKITFKGRTGYINMNYVKLKTSNSGSSGGSSGGSDSGSAYYRITPRIGLNVRAGRGTNHKRLTAIPYGKTVAIRDIKDGWGKTSYNGKSGYVAMQYVEKTGSSLQYVTKSTSTHTREHEESSTPPSAENKIGRVEVYGFDINGNKLFKMEMKDAEKYYEYSEPAIEFGSQLVLDDGTKCPNPRTITEKSDDDKSVTKETDSGKFGDWNEFDGWFTIERKTVNGKQQWYAKVEKMNESGNVVKTIETQRLIGNYPQGALNNIVVFIGGYKDEPIVDVMNVNEVYVTSLMNPPKPEVQRPIFRKGDILIVDNQAQKAYLNGKPIMKKVDIGSQFFNCPVGHSTIKCGSDDEGVIITTAMQKRWL